MRILGISGSLRRDSFNTRLLAAAAERLPEDVELGSLGRARSRASVRRGRRSGAGAGRGR